MFLTVALDSAAYEGLPPSSLERAAVDGVAATTTTLVVPRPRFASTTSLVAAVPSAAISDPPVRVQTVVAHIANIATFSAPAALREQTNADLRARMSWVTYWFVLALASVTAVVGASLITARSVPPDRTMSVLGASISLRRLYVRLVALSVLGSIFGFFWTCDSTAGFYVTKQLFQVVNDHGVFVPTVSILTGATNWLTICSAATVMLAISAGLTPPDGSRSLEEQGQYVSSQIWKLEVLLYLSAAVLIAGLLEILSLFRAALPFLTEDSRKLAEGTILGFAWIAGVVFSAFLVMIYLPPRVVHALRAIALAREARPTWKEQAEWLSDRGLSVTFSGQLKTLAAVLSPILTGPLGALLAQLKV